MNIYEALDITQGEKKVYAALIKLRSSTTGPLYRKAQVSQSKVYEILDRLQKKGLAASIVKNGKTFWHPANPSIFLKKIEHDLEIVKERKKVLEKELPQLLKQDTYPSDEAQVLVGYNGFRSCLYSLLDTFSSQEEFLVLGSPVVIPEPFNTFLKAFNKERIDKNIHAKFLYGEKLRTFAKEMYSLPKTKLRFMSGLTPSTIAIGKDRIIIMTWENTGKFVVIMGTDIANSYRLFFESLWKMSKK
jgi:sugar-specific transcriptional regulator TrmB|tara:strand:- start:517 stop:1251 length:735 start_codon:yes stop_codon:yes gene_type:complete